MTALDTTVLDEAELLQQVRLSAVMLSSALVHYGWKLIDREGVGAQTLVPVGAEWQAYRLRPRIVARPVVGSRGRGVLWWHWDQPAGVRDIPIARVSDGDRTLRMIVATLAKHRIPELAGRPAP